MNFKPELLNAFRNYDKKTFIGDAAAGLIVAVIALPLSIAFGIQSKMPDATAIQSGIISSIVGGLLVSALGGAKFSVGGPSATFLAVTVAYVAQFGAAGLHLIMILAGVILIAAGLLRAGATLKYVPFPVIVGFTAGIGLTLLVGQAKDFLGLTLPGDNPADFMPKIAEYAKNITSFNAASFCVGLIALAAVFLIPKINKNIPAAFFAIILASAAAAVINAAGFGNVSTVGSVYGDVKASFNPIDMGGLNGVNVFALLPPAFIIALLAALEGLLSATVADGIANTSHNPDTELAAYGAANVGVALCGGIPVTGVIARTSANVDGGAKTPLAGIFSAALLTLIYLLLMPAVKFVPFAALAAVLIKVAVNMSRFTQFIKFLTFGIRDCAILAATFLLTVFLGVTVGVLVGVGLAFVINIQNFVARMEIKPVEFDDVEDGEKFQCPRRAAYKLFGAVFFVSVNRLVKTVAAAAENYDEIVLDMGALARIDATAVERLAKRAKLLSRADKRLVLHNLKGRAYARYQKAFEDIIIRW